MKVHNHNITLAIENFEKRLARIEDVTRFMFMWFTLNFGSKKCKGDMKKMIKELINDRKEAKELRKRLPIEFQRGGD